MASPQNLADEAVLDQAILKRSLREFGPVKAAEMRDRLMAQVAQVDRGVALGRIHPDLPFKRPIMSPLISAMIPIRRGLIDGTEHRIYPARRRATPRRLRMPGPVELSHV